MKDEIRDQNNDGILKLNTLEEQGEWEEIVESADLESDPFGFMLAYAASWQA